jgi:hypothetical protein
MKTNKITLIASIIIIAVLTYLGFIVAELNQYNEITTNDINISNAVQQAIIFNTIKALLCIFAIGYICIELKDYYDRRKELNNIKDKVKDFADFLAMSRSKVEEADHMFSIRRTREGNIHKNKENPVTPDNVFKDIVFDKKSSEVKPRRENYPLSNEGFEQWQTAMNEWNNSNEKS